MESPSGEVGGGCDAIADDVVAGGIAPVAAAACTARAPEGWRSEEGGAVDTLFDLASLTKPMTALAVARSGMPLGAPIGELLPLAQGTASAGVPLELLLAHRAGLEAHVPLYAPVERGEPLDRDEALRAAANARRGDARGEVPAGGFAPVYSDLGYLLAGAALARWAGALDAGDAIERLVVEPLGLLRELGTARGLEARGIDVAARAAPTEHVAWRGGIVRGRVHDENAWAMTASGGSGHAGLFGTARAVLAFGRAVLVALAGDPALAWLVRERAGGTLRAGFDGRSERGSSAGDRMGPRAFGHLGFTGTSVWLDPDAGVVVVLLTNRVHLGRDHVAIRAARPVVHDRLFSRARALLQGVN